MYGFTGRRWAGTDPIETVCGVDRIEELDGEGIGGRVRESKEMHFIFLTLLTTKKGQLFLLIADKCDPLQDYGY